MRPGDFQRSLFDRQARAQGAAARTRVVYASEGSVSECLGAANPFSLFTARFGRGVSGPDRLAQSRRESATILRTLEESLAINAVGRTGTAWDSSDRRARWMRNCLAERLREERGSPLKVLMKFGYNHMIRGANYVNIFDVGAMTDEVAALKRSSRVPYPRPPGPRFAPGCPRQGRSFTSVSSDEFDEFRAGDQRLTRVLPNANATGHEVIDLRALRPLAMRGLESWNPDVVRTIHGYDAAVMWKGACVVILRGPLRRRRAAAATSAARSVGYVIPNCSRYVRYFVGS